ncbi:hypothetical protein TL16_g04633 [Triparma laevis f. inornata]|uniref:Chloride channel protein n=2 Tax=Triparma laevis TaxID=1534972 RepID=A0A9W7KU50_9STRA|nr:hypothetical protein TL16_g04633 [Triparma laevis f. inornata]GMI11421.1 hypothetical protein TrLO_g5168 [Triparma laevis f. longispina]
MLWKMTQTPTIVILIGVLTACIAVIVNVCTSKIYPLRKSIVFGIPDELLIIKYGLYLCCALLAANLSNFVTQWVCPEAAGGGLPEVKTLLDGSYKRALVTPRTIVAKSVGLTLAISAGLSVGKEGPFVHIAVSIADTLMRMTPFRHLAKNDAKRLEILACAAAAGVGATFGTPFAAVLFSIEVTAGYFMVRNLPRCFLCAISGTLSITFLGYNKAFALFSDFPKMAQGYHMRDLVSFVLLGVLCGLLGCVFNVGVKKAVEVRNNFLGRGGDDPSKVAKLRYLYVTMVTFIVSPFIFYDMTNGVASFGDQHSIVNYMFQMSPLGLTTPLLLYLPFKFFVTIMCVTLPLPVGLFTPVFLIGGTSGRIIGEFLRLLDTHFLEKHGVKNFITFQPWEFALIGAASFSSGVTRAISTALIILELSGEHHLRTPCGVAVLVAYFIGNRFTKGIYDILVDTNGNPMLPELPDVLAVKTAEEVMESYKSEKTAGSRYFNQTWHPRDEDADGNVSSSIPPIISLDTTPREVIYMFGSSSYNLPDNRILPVVNSSDASILVGAVVVGDLRNAVENIVKAASLMDSEENVVSNFYVVGKSGSSSVQLNKLGEEKNEGVDEEEGGKGGKKKSSKEGSLLDRRLPFVVWANGGLHPVIKEEQQQSSKPQRISSNWTVAMDPAPYQIVHTTELSKIHLVFRMLKLHQAFVTNNGRLVGIVNRTLLRKFIGKREKRPSDRLYVLWGGIKDCFNRNVCGEDEGEDAGRVSVGQEDENEGLLHHL